MSTSQDQVESWVAHAQVISGGSSDNWIKETHCHSTEDVNGSILANRVQDGVAVRILDFWVGSFGQSETHYNNTRKILNFITFMLFFYAQKVINAINETKDCALRNFGKVSKYFISIIQLCN